MDNYIHNTNVRTLDSSLSSDIDGELTPEEVDAVLGVSKTASPQGGTGFLWSSLKSSWILFIQFDIKPT